MFVLTCWKYIMFIIWGTLENVNNNMVFFILPYKILKNKFSTPFAILTYFYSHNKSVILLKY